MPQNSTSKTPETPTIPHIEPSPARVRDLIPPDSKLGELDETLADLRRHAGEWAWLETADRRSILQEITKDFAAVGERWFERCRDAEGIPAHRAAAGEEWLAGPYMILRNLTLLERSLAQIDRYGKPRVPGPVTERADGTTVARVFPTDIWDQVFYSGVTGEVWMQDGVTPQNLEETMAVAYAGGSENDGSENDGSENDGSEIGAISLVLGAGNVSSIGPMDVLYKLFVEKKTTILKMHPVNAYLGPLISEGFQALIDWGVLRVVYGDARVGQYLCEHKEVDEIHITGSDKTVETIVFGPGEEGQERKRQRRPKNTTPISSELGNVSPVIVVPGPWSKADLAFQGENIASMLTNNAGFNCNAARVVIQHGGWGKREALRGEIRKQLAAIPTRHAYYPGAAERWARFVRAHPEAEKFGNPGDGELPWTFIPGVDPEHGDDICFQQEAFCGVLAESALEAATTADFIDKAVSFCNETLWGTLNAAILIHPKSLQDPAIRAAFERALETLNYGTIGVNAWPAVGYGLVVTPWGAPPGHDIYDIQSGSGEVHNTLMFSRIRKTVVKVPFRMRPKPLWFASHKTAQRMAAKVTRFEEDPSITKLPGIFWEALRG